METEHFNILLTCNDINIAKKLRSILTVSDNSFMFYTHFCVNLFFFEPTKE